MIWCSLVILTAVHSSRLKTGTVRVWLKEIGSKFDFMFTVDHISCNPHRAPRHCRFDYYRHVAKGLRQDEPPGGEIRGQFSVAFGQTRIPNFPFWPDKDHYFSLSEALFGAGLLHCLVGGLWPDKAPQQCIRVIWGWLIFPHGEFYLILGFCGQRQVDFLLFYMFVLAIQRKASQRI